MGFTTWMREPGKAWDAPGWSEFREDAEAYAEEERRFFAERGMTLEIRIHAEPADPPTD
jgi:hypothetical protein